jgi:hypothetical protein
LNLQPSFSTKLTALVRLFYYGGGGRGKISRTPLSIFLPATRKVEESLPAACNRAHTSKRDSETKARLLAEQVDYQKRQGGFHNE